MRFVSIGGDCQPAAQIRKRTGSNATSAFDWLETPVTSAMTLIENHFDGFFADREWTARGENDWRVRDIRCKVTADHSFKSQDLAHVAQVVQSFRFLGRLFMEQLHSGEPLCYVRRWHHCDGTATEDDARALYRLLASINPNAGFLYLQLKEERDPIIEGRYISAYNPPTRTNWEGDDEVYRRNFDFAESALPGFLS